MKKYYLLLPPTATLLFAVLLAFIFADFNNEFDWSASHRNVKEGTVSDYIFSKSTIIALFFGALASALLWSASHFKSRKLTIPFGLITFIAVLVWGGYFTGRAYVVEHDWISPLGLMLVPAVAVVAEVAAMVCGWLAYHLRELKRKVTKSRL